MSGLRAWRSALALGLLAALSLGGYLLFSRAILTTGFPLDDAWIHQTYARNLALYGEWSFVPGQPSAGSTAPLWSALLALGPWLRLGPYILTYVVGWLLLWGLGWLGVLAGRRLGPAQGRWSAWAGVLLVLEWHLVWAAGSGMETLLLAALALLALAWLLRGDVSPLGLGLLIGGSVWVRPDGITLLGPALLALLAPVWRAEKPQILRAVRIVLSLAAGVLLLFVPYLFFNRALAGAFWPNTFFAKQAEYAILQQTPLWQRLAQLIGLPLVGVGVLLAPGFLARMWIAWRRRQWAVLAGGLWALGYLALYAWRLPVVYQHGRYVMPAMPVLFVWGWSGLGYLFRRLPAAGDTAAGRLAWIGQRVTLLSLALVLLLFWVQGGLAYARDVAVIETEMVATAGWIREHTAPDDLIAAHDIGALGYFAGRPLLDLAGLVSPEVIPFIRQEGRLQDYLDRQQAQYLVIFPDWYPQLAGLRPAIYSTDGVFAPEQGAVNMRVYRWKAP